VCQRLGPQGGGDAKDPLESFELVDGCGSLLEELGEAGAVVTGNSAGRMEDDGAGEIKETMFNKNIVNQCSIFTFTSIMVKARLMVHG
jgi:hypothetical protein